MAPARRAIASDLPSLLALFREVEVSRHVEPGSAAEVIWAETLADRNLALFVSDAGGRIVAS